MCTVLLRFRPELAWPVVFAAVRDEFLDRPWDPPAAHWPEHPEIVGGRDRTAGGTWLAVRTAGTVAAAALLNGVRLPLPTSGVRPSRGGLPLAALTDTMPDLLPEQFDGYDGFHLLRTSPTTVDLVTYDGSALVRTAVGPGDHIITNDGLDAVSDPTVVYFAPLLAELPDPPLPDSWGTWPALLQGDGLPLDDPRALIIRREFGGRVYGSGSLALVALSADGARYDFSPTPTIDHFMRIA